MEKCNFKDAWRQVVAGLSDDKRTELAAEIALLEQLVEPRPHPVSAFWRDQARSAQVRAAMRQAGRARRARLRLVWRSSDGELVTDYAEAARLVGHTERAVRLAVSRGNGVAHFLCDDDVVTVQRIYA
jgi:hypothetical protein